MQQYMYWYSLTVRVDSSFDDWVSLAEVHHHALQILLDAINSRIGVSLVDRFSRVSCFLFALYRL